MAVNKFNRFFKLTLNNEIVIENLRAIFRVERIRGASIHTMELSLFNVNNLFGRAGLTSFKDDVDIVLEAGYENENGVLFEGIVRNVSQVKVGAETESKIYCYDNKFSKRKKLSFTLVNPENVNNIIEKLAEEEKLEVAENNIEGGNQVGAFIANKSFKSHMDELSTKYLFNWYILNKKLYVHSKAIGSGKEYEISAESGMIETPVLTESGINVKTLMAAKIKPNDKFQVLSNRFAVAQSGLEVVAIRKRGLSSNFVNSLVHTGDTHGDLWFTEIIGLAVP